jgi:hypothetical protein
VEDLPHDFALDGPAAVDALAVDALVLDRSSASFIANSSALESLKFNPANLDATACKASWFFLGSGTAVVNVSA